VACLGLYGLATHKVQQRTKEVGVRKVLGASVTGILALLSRDFVKLLIIAFLVAAPVAYYIMNDWLNGFAFHININVFTMIATLVMMILVAGLTVGYRTYKAAVGNPVNALREE
jgi:putative ABC transport system permease protein